MTIAIIIVAGACLLGTYPYEIGLLLPYVAIVTVIAVAARMRKGIS